MLVARPDPGILRAAGWVSELTCVVSLQAEGLLLGPGRITWADRGQTSALLIISLLSLSGSWPGLEALGGALLPPVLTVSLLEARDMKQSHVKGRSPMTLFDR